MLGTADVHPNPRNFLQRENAIHHTPAELVSHGVTPIEAVLPDKTGYRDVLVVTFRRKTAWLDAERSAFFRAV